MIYCVTRKLCNESNGSGGRSTSRARGQREANIGRLSIISRSTRCSKSSPKRASIARTKQVLTHLLNFFDACASTSNMSTVSNHAPVPNNLQDLSTIVTIARLRDALRVSKNIIVIAGAYLQPRVSLHNALFSEPEPSITSPIRVGIPTFQDGGGLWRSLDATTLATPTALATIPSLVWRFYYYQRLRQVFHIENDRSTDISVGHWSQSQISLTTSSQSSPCPNSDAK